MPGVEPSSPRVSVVTATYNRANVLRFSIESLRAQTVSDWELIVVGDACTDDTEDVVRSFDDPRIRFVNLPVNSGEQATPNNEGVRLARGEFVAFLNHDDLWTPDHLAVCLDAIERRKADLVWTLTVLIRPDGTPALAGACAAEKYESYVIAPASSWLVRRDVASAAGPWRTARELFLPPSQEWLFRFWKSGRDLHPVGLPTVLAVQSGRRRDSYAERHWEENAAWAARLAADPHLLLRLAAEVGARQTAANENLAVYRHLRRALRNVIRRAAATVGMHPAALYLAVKYKRRGGFLDSIRATRGLSPLPREGKRA